MTRLPDHLAADDPGVLAPLVDLVVTTDEEPGIRRVRRGRGFSYHLPDGGLVEGTERDRIEQLAIPPAWTDVWIAVVARAYLQATGRDDLERKQYRYHDAYRELQETRKFRRLAWFGPALDELRRHVAATIEDPDPRARAHAVVLRLLDVTAIRIGDTDPSPVTGSRGALSLTAEHIDLDGDHVHLDFTGKGGGEREVEVQDHDLAHALHDVLREHPDRPFSYADDAGHVHVVSQTSVNQRIQEVTGSPFTARDFRTWGGTVTAAATLLTGEASASDSRDDIAAVDAAAERLGNTRAVARASYVAPVVLEAWADGSLCDVWQRTRTGARLSRVERTVMRVLEDDARADDLAAA